MHPTEVDQGVTLAGRYRVMELLAEAPGDEGVVAQTWRAIDEVLSRSVVVYVLSAEDSRAEEMLEASRRAATVSDVRFLRVLDALREDGLAYVVREWVEGRTLAQLLSANALPPRDAGLVVREVAEALSRAHAQELYHERLDPDSVIITDGGTIKIVGLATQAALSAHQSRSQGADPDVTAGGSTAPASDPVRTDTVGLGRMLYAALTGRWPTGPRSGLPAGPRAADGTLLSPRQCRAGVPRALDEITERILSERPRHGTPLADPREIVDALTGTVGTTPPEGVLASSRPPATGSSFVATSPASTRSSPSHPSHDQTAAFERPLASPDPAQGTRTAPAGHGGAGSGPGAPGGPGGPAPYGGAAGGPPPQRPMRPYRPQRSGPRWSRVGVVLVVAVLLIGIGLLGWQLLKDSLPTDPGGSDEAPGGQTGPGDTKQPKTNEPLEIVAADDYDPSVDGGNDEEHPEEVPNTYDGDPGTSWQTMEYYDGADYGSIKPGVGVWFDLGKATTVREVEVSLYGPGPTDLEILVPPDGANTIPESIDDWDEVGKTDGAADSATIELDKGTKTRYVLVYLTKIPPEGGAWRGGITDTVIK